MKTEKQVRATLRMAEREVARALRLPSGTGVWSRWQGIVDTLIWILDEEEEFPK